MYSRYFPQTFSPHWVIADDDPDNKYIELLGYNGEYLIAISHEMFVGFGPSSQLEQIQRSLGGVLMVSEAFGQALVFKHVQFMPQDHDLMVTASKIIKSYATAFQVTVSDFIGGILSNENRQYLGRLDFKREVIN